MILHLSSRTDIKKIRLYINNFIQIVDHWRAKCVETKSELKEV